MPAMRGMMMNTARYGCVFLLFVVLTACGGGTDDKTDVPQPGFSPAPGLGGSTGNPTGAAFALPAGVTARTLVGAHHPRDADGNKVLAQPQCDGFTSATVEVVNLAHGYVDLCIELVNSASTAASFTLPGGLIFTSRDDLIQNGLLVQSVNLTVPAGTTWVLVRLYCLNASYAGADGRHYRVGPTTDFAPLQEVVTLVRDKQIDQSETWTVQTAVWQVTDNPAGLTDAMRASLNAL